MRLIALFRHHVLPVVAAGFVAAGTATAGPIISTPTGLNPGDHFRIVFVTTDELAATSANIADYNTFVNTEAQGATYNGSTITWSALASTSTIDAKTNIGSYNDKVYMADGTLVTNSDTAAGLWSGALQIFTIDENLTSQVKGFVWTGTMADGTQVPGYGLGSTSGSAYGTNFNGYSASHWVYYSVGDPSTTKHLYGISSDLVVPGGASSVPEPSTAMLAGLGGLVALVYSLKRKRN